jgi:hypothetical protein
MEDGCGERTDCIDDAIVSAICKDYSVVIELC